MASRLLRQLSWLGRGWAIQTKLPIHSQDAHVCGVFCIAKRGVEDLPEPLQRKRGTELRHPSAWQSMQD